MQLIERDIWFVSEILDNTTCPPGIYNHETSAINPNLPMPAIYSYCKDGIVFNHVYDIDSSQDPFLIINKNGNQSKLMLD